MQAPRVVSMPCSEEDAFLLPRACRPFRSAGVALADPLPVRTVAELADFLDSASAGPALIVRPGAWPVAAAAAAGSRPSLPRVADGALLLGAVTCGPEAGRWKRLQAACGGDLRALPWSKRWRMLPLPAFCLLGAETVRRFAGLLNRGLPFGRALHRLALWTPDILGALDPALDGSVDPVLRIMQAVTSLQRGGAERICLDLAGFIPAVTGVRCAVAVLGRPGRAAWRTPAALFDLSATPAYPAARAEALLRSADAWGADVVHVHLLSAETSAALKSRGVPVAATLHNQAVAWPTGTALLPARSQADLLLGCSRTVATEMESVFGESAPPVRALPNGVPPAPLSREVAAAARTRLRAAWGFGAEDVVLLAVANPRPQKRLETLPLVAAAARAADPAGRRFRLVIAGSAGLSSPGAAESMEKLRAAAGAAPAGDVLLLGDVPYAATLMAAADVLVCPSLHEGLSLSWLEALREGLPVASAEVGAAAEVAAEAAGSFHLAPRGDDLALAQAVLRAVPSPKPALPPGFDARAMAARAVALCRRTVARKASTARARRPAGVWIVTCNLALGGAQSSCRRLLETLHARGLPARCAVVEEPPARPTLGLKMLRAAGIAAHAIPPGRPSTQAAALLARMDADPPEAVLFWNLPPVLRVRLADLMLGAARVIDVSPGEMSFRSLARFFADPDSRVDLPYPDARAYGTLLHGAVVKYRGEAETAARVLGCPVRVIANGVPIPGSPCPRLLLSAPAGPVIFGTAARLSPDKCLEEIFAAFRLALPALPPGSRLLVAGAADSACGKYARALRRSCRGLPVDFPGRLDGDALRERLHRRLDAFVMASRPAGCPNASLEALAAGLPVIATDWGGACDQIDHEITGLLTPDGDTAALADAMVRLARDPALRRWMALAAREQARERFSLDRMTDDYVNFCLADSPPTARAQPSEQSMLYHCSTPEGVY